VLRGTVVQYSCWVGRGVGRAAERDEDRCELCAVDAFDHHRFRVLLYQLWSAVGIGVGNE